MTLVVDFSVIAHKSWHSIFSPNFEPQYKVLGKDEKNQDILQPWTELEEFSRNLCMNLFYLKSLYKPDEMILAMDAPSNWRADYVKQWYHDRVKVYEQLEGVEKPTFYVTFDQVQWNITYVSQIDTWVTTKVKVKELFEPSEWDHKVYNYDEIKDHDVWKLAIEKKLVPYYKGTRKNGNWVAYTPKDEFKAETARLGLELAPLLGARAIMVDNAEGDDVVTMSVLDAEYFDPAQECVVVSIDQDLYQLATSHSNFIYYNPNTRKEIPLRSDVAKLKLAYKIIGGDGSDNIRGISMMDSNKAMVEVKTDAEGVVKSGKGTVNYVDNIIQPLLTQGKTGADLFAPLYRTLEAEADIDTLYRNVQLIFLKNIPVDIQEVIKDRLMNDEVLETSMKWEDFGMSGKDKVSVINKANNERAEVRGWE